MADELTEALDQLTPMQKEASTWGDGPMLVLAGPGSGKTRVLTTRIGLLLRNTDSKILALTFTTKAADEMRSRIKVLAQESEDRVLTGTFHSFCVNVLRRHGIHIGIQPDFSIYSRDDDRIALLVDALRVSGREDLIQNASSYLKSVDSLRKRLMGSASAAKVVTGSEMAKTVAFVYDLYEKTLQQNGIQDFYSLIFETCRLFKTYPAIAERYCKTYRYWLLDEFQDTNPAQYFLIKTLAGQHFRNIFVVADDDQIIYQWNGASYKQIQSFRKDFEPELIQLPTNFRCPPAIVEAANLLIANNTYRSPEKKPLESGKTSMRHPTEEHIRVLSFEDSATEISTIGTEISANSESIRNSIVILGRTRKQLEAISTELRKVGVTAVIAQRRDSFLTPHFTWLDASLKQCAFPLDHRCLRTLIQSFNRMAGIDISAEAVIAEAETTSVSYIDVWSNIVTSTSAEQIFKDLATNLRETSRNTASYRAFISSTVPKFKVISEQNSENLDLVDDLDAWRSLLKEISETSDAGIGLPEFTQELEMRSKEPPLRDGNVALMTIHGAKGKEFDYVYLTGAVESSLPSHQSIKAGDVSIEMEEERRNCFVAITRTKECLTITWPKRQMGYARKPSRFLFQMNLIKRNKPNTG